MIKLTKDKNFSKRLRSLIIDRLQMTQTEFCEKHNITTGYLSMILSEKRGPSADLIANIYLHYSEHMCWLLTGQDELAIGESHKEGPNSAHPDLVALFQQGQLAMDIIWDLVKLERMNPKELKEVKEFVKYRLLRRDLLRKEGTRTGKKES